MDQTNGSATGPGGTFQPLPIRDAVDERAADVLGALFQAWRMYQDRKASKPARRRAAAAIERLWGAAGVAGPGPGGRKELVPIFYEQLLPVADSALEAY